MKIVHTADWHLGKRLENKSRLSEQFRALEELNELCEREKADIVVVAGDVYDSAIPSAEAEELFYKAAVMLSKNRPLVAIAGNHDDAERLKAPFAVAKSHGIYLVGDMDNSRLTSDGVMGGEGFLRFNLGGEILNLATLPFPSRSRLGGKGGDSYADFVLGYVNKCVSCFDKGVNVFASHLYMDDCLLSDERPASSVLLTKEVLPVCDYCALGHIHKPQCISKSKNAYYSGSLLKYHFDEGDQKEFVIYNSSDRSVTHYPITSGEKLYRVGAASFAEAMSEVSKLSGYVELVYESATPLKPSEAEQLRSLTQLAKLTVVNKSLKREVLRRRELTDAQIFDTYYRAVRGEAPSEETVKAFLEVLEQ